MLHAHDGKLFSGRHSVAAQVCRIAIRTHGCHPILDSQGFAVNAEEGTETYVDPKTGQPTDVKPAEAAWLSMWDEEYEHVSLCGEQRQKQVSEGSEHATYASLGSLGLLKAVISLQLLHVLCRSSSTMS